LNSFSENTAKKMSEGAKKKKPAKAILAGGISGCIEVLINYPTEYVKIQLQLHERSKSFAMETKVPKYTGVTQCIKSTFYEYGIFGFYRGLSPLLYMCIPKAAVRFAAFEELKNMMQDSQGKLTRKQTALAGLGAGVSEAILVVTPMDTLKVKLIHDISIRAQPIYRGFFHGVYCIVKEEGFLGVYKGFTPTLVKQGLFKHHQNGFE